MCDRYPTARSERRGKINREWSLHLTAVAADLAGIRRFVEEAATALGASPAVIPGVVLAVDEAATNTIIHGYGGHSADIDITLSRRGDVLLVHLSDQAPPFDPTTVPPPDLALPLDERPVGGMGVFLMRTVMDHVSYRRTPDGRNTLIMVKRGAFPNQA